MNTLTTGLPAIDSDAPGAYFSPHELVASLCVDHDDDHDNLHGRAAVAHALIEA